MHRVQKLLNNYGYCSRRKAEELIREGKVTVNDRVVSLGDKASEDDKIYVDGKLIRIQTRVYLMFNKPLGYVTALRDEKFNTVMDCIKLKERVFPIGRLDYNTSGLLLLTNDGDFANEIMHPRYRVNKTYLIGIDKPIRDREVRLIRSGVKLADGRTSPARVKKRNLTMLEVTIHEGKKRIVRRIFEKLGFKVRLLKRIKIGNLNLGDLGLGRYRHLTKADKQKIFETSCR